MITGYNTDVKHKDRVFHVQTEDKGTGNPYLETLIYVGGQVLDAKRTSYEDLVEDVSDRKAVAKIMDSQHRAMIRDIEKGSYDQKVEELFGTNTVPAMKQGPEEGDSEPAERTLDEVILEYLTTEAQQDHLVLHLEEETELTVGESSNITVRASSSKSSLPLDEVDVAVKMISTADQPRILASGKTGDDGTIELEVTVPELGEGSAALIITADSLLGKAELKYML